MDAALAEQFRRETLECMRERGGEMSWLGTLGVEAFQELEKMEAEGLIERVTDKDRPFRMIYRLKSLAIEMD